MKKILHVIRNIGDGGTEMFMMNSILNMNHSKFKNIILTYDKVTNWKKEIKKNNIKIIQIQDPSKTGILGNIKYIKKTIKEENIDVVHSYTHYNSGYVMLAAFLCGIKTRITHSHRTESNGCTKISYRIYSSISKLLINIFSNVRLACGKEAGESLFYKFKKFTILNNGIVLDKYIFSNDIRNKIRKELKISNKDIVIGTIGRLDYNKNQKFLINVFNEYNKKNKNSKLLIVGDGVEKENLEEQTKKLGLINKVIFTGSRKDANELYNVMDLFMLTSYKEGLPFVLIEAQANGLSCIVSDSVSKSSNISNSIIFKSLDDTINEWVKTIDNINFKRKDNIDYIIKNEYSIKNTVEKLEKIYEN